MSDPNKMLTLRVRRGDFERWLRNSLELDYLDMSGVDNWTGYYMLDWDHIKQEQGKFVERKIKESQCCEANLPFRRREADRRLAERDAVIRELAEAILAYSDADKDCECWTGYGDYEYCDSCKEAALKDDPDASHPDEFYRYKHGVASENLHKLAKKLREIGGDR